MASAKNVVLHMNQLTLDYQYLESVYVSKSNLKISLLLMGSPVVTY